MIGSMIVQDVFTVYEQTSIWLLTNVLLFNLQPSSSDLCCLTQLSIYHVQYFSRHLTSRSFSFLLPIMWTIRKTHCRMTHCLSLVNECKNLHELDRRSIDIVTWTGRYLPMDRFFSMARKWGHETTSKVFLLGSTYW
jgi:hypothetical protein